jgi:hypothetical protein
MRKLLIILVLMISGLVKSQNEVYIIGEDSVSWVLQSGVGEKILHQYKLELALGSETIYLTNAIRSYVNDSLVNFCSFYDNDEPYNNYTKLNTEIVFESHIILKGLGMFADPYDQFFLDSLFTNFKNSEIKLDRDERYMVIFELDERYQPGFEMYPSDEEPIPFSRHIILKIRRILR